MPLETTTEGSARIIKISGRMTPELVDQTHQAFEDELRAGHKRLVVDISELQYVSSLGLRAFVQLAKAVHGTDRVAVLCGMKGMVKEIFDVAFMGVLFRTFDNVDAALASFDESGMKE